MEDFIRQQ